MSQPAPEGCPSPPTPDRLSVIGSEIEALADTAPTLKEAELRVLLELTHRQLRSPDGVRAGSRELASACKLERRNVVRALDSLATRCLITTRQGTTTTPAIHRVNILDTKKIPGVKETPPPGRQRGYNDNTLEFFQPHPGVEGTPPPAESTALTRAAPRVEISTALPPELNRVLRSKVSDFDPDLVAFTRRYLHSFFTKMGVDDNHRRFLDTGAAPHPPDDKLVAQLLAVAEPPRLYACLDNLVTERGHEPYNYGWFIAVALQRIHGISWQQTKQARTALRDMKRKQQPAPAEQTGLEFARNLTRQALAAVPGGRKR